jgi:hypothetical protein
LGPAAPFPPGWDLKDEVLPRYVTRKEEATIQAREKATATEEFILCPSAMKMEARYQTRLTARLNPLECMAWVELVRDALKILIIAKP